jgi:ubiquitin-activating enzyme E1
MMTDFAKFDRPALLHAGFRGLAAHVDQSGVIAPGDSASADKVLAATKTFFDGEMSDDHADIIKKLAIGSCAVLSPMCAAIGGIVGQEVLKSCSGKFTPINGFFYFDATETLAESLDAADVAPRNSRYDSQIAVFGYEAQKALFDLNYFLVGGGAIGCEVRRSEERSNEQKTPSMAKEEKCFRAHFCTRSIFSLIAVVILTHHSKPFRA